MQTREMSYELRRRLGELKRQCDEYYGVEMFKAGNDKVPLIPKLEEILQAFCETVEYPCTEICFVKILLSHAYEIVSSL